MITNSIGRGSQAVLDRRFKGYSKPLASPFEGKLPYEVRAFSPKGRRIPVDGRVLRAYNAGDGSTRGGR